MAAAQRVFCEQDHPGGDAEAEDWCRRYHRPQMPKPVRAIAEQRSESDPCERGTDGCCIDHTTEREGQTNPRQDQGCDTW